MGQQKPEENKKKSRVFFILSLPLSQDRAHLLLISVPVKGIFLSLKYSPNFCPAGLSLPLQLIIVYISRHREQCCIDNEGYFCLLKAILKPPLSPVSFLLSSTDFPSRIYFLGPFVAFPGSPITPYFFLGGAQLLLKAAMCCLKSNNFTPRTSSHIFQKFILWSVTAFKHHSGMLLLQQMFCPCSNCSYLLFQSIFSAPWSFSLLPGLAPGQRDVDF